MCCLIFVVLLFMIANGFAVLNLAPQHDTINHVVNPYTVSSHYNVGSSSHQLQLGRFLLQGYTNLMGDARIITPWITGVLSIVYLTVTVYLIAKMFEMDNKPGIFVISAALVCNTCMTTLLSVFTYVTDAYRFATLLGVIGVYLLYKRAGLLSDLLAIPLFVCTLGIYQAEIPVAMIVLILAVVKDLLRNKEIPWKDILKWIVIFAVSGVIYFVIYKITLRAANIGAGSDYNDLSALGNLSVVGILKDLLRNAWNWWNFFFGNNCFVNGTRVPNICLLILSAAGFVMTAKHLKVQNTIFTVLCLIAVPVLGFSMSVLMGMNKLQYYCSYGLFLIYPAMALVIREGFGKIDVRRISKGLIVVLMGVVFFKNAVYANAAYTIQNIIFERTESIMTLINADLMDLEGYEAGKTEVVVVGYFVKNETILDLPTDPYSQLPAFSDTSLTYAQTWSRFARNFGIPINVTIDQSLKEECSDMPAFPNKGYLKMEDGRVILKISD